jgi:hypothetical protein
VSSAEAGEVLFLGEATDKGGNSPMEGEGAQFLQIPRMELDLLRNKVLREGAKEDEPSCVKVDVVSVDTLFIKIEYKSLGAELLPRCVGFFGVLWPSDLVHATDLEGFLVTINFGW